MKRVIVSSVFLGLCFYMHAGASSGDVEQSEEDSSDIGCVKEEDALGEEVLGDGLFGESEEEEDEEAGDTDEIQRQKEYECAQSMAKEIRKMMQNLALQNKSEMVSIVFADCGRQEYRQ